MKRLLLVFVTLFCFSGIARAEENYQLSDMMENEGLTATLLWLQSQNPDGQNQFLLGGVEALRAIELIFQTRYDHFPWELPLIPGGRTQIRSNPDAVFDPAFVEIAMTGALERLAQAQEYLKGAVGQDFTARVDLSKIWFDTDRNGQRDSDEGLTDLLNVLPGMRSVVAKVPIVRFDMADADWLAAYVHVLSGMAEVVLALDPTPAIRVIADGRAHLDQIGAITADPIFGGGQDYAIDIGIAALTSLRGVPDRNRTRSALAHFKAMISHNQNFWLLVMLETDNEGEWLPNPDQSSAFGIAVDFETAKAWQSVLRELSDVLEGRLLLPHWRISSTDGAEAVGINFADLMHDPGDFDIVLMVHGAAIAPYLEQGKIVNQEAWQRFSQLTGGQGELFSLWFN